MLFSKSLLFVSAIGVTQVVGKTPAGFTPATDTDLIVTYGQVAPQNEVEVAQDAVASQPSLATTSQLSGSSYAVIMVDLDIPVDTNPHTLLHWMQTDLTPATTAISGAGTAAHHVFPLQNTKNTPALADYIGPAPPARNPLSHRYVQVLVDTSNLSTEGLETLRNATSERVGFDVAKTLAAAGLSDSQVVAGNSYNVTNPGPVQTSNSKDRKRAPEQWNADGEVQRRQQATKATKASKGSAGSNSTKASSSVTVGVFERNGTIIVGVFTGNNTLKPPTNGTTRGNGTAGIVPVRGNAPPALPSSAGWTTGLLCCILGLMFTL